MSLFTFRRNNSIKNKETYILRHKFSVPNSGFIKETGHQKLLLKMHLSQLNQRFPFLGKFTSLMKYITTSSHWDCYPKATPTS